MTRFYHPDRIDYDMVVSSGHDGRRLWSTAGVEVVDPSSVLVEGGRPMDGDAFRAYAASVAPRLRDFAERLTGVELDAGSTAGRYESYQRVRGIVRDAEGMMLAEVRCDGSVTVLGELDPTLRRQFIGMINGWLPMTIREVDRYSYENALASLVKARRVVDSMLREVIGIAAGGPDPLAWDQVAEAAGTTPTALTTWFSTPDELINS
ncbi:MAG TPA: hypothetical protein VFN97_05005 [Actinospica sp.]|nr:hypothetical protein [Actinospica sp.]